MAWRPRSPAEPGVLVQCCRRIGASTRPVRFSGRILTSIDQVRRDPRARTEWCHHCRRATEYLYVDDLYVDEKDGTP